MRKELEDTLKAYYAKHKIAREHNMRFTDVQFAKSIRKPYGTVYGYIVKLIDMGLLKENRDGLTRKGISYLKDIS